MGNCIFGGTEEDPPYESTGSHGSTIQVTTSSGGIMEFRPPTTAGRIIEEFPGHAIFRGGDHFWNPVPDEEELQPGESYYLLLIRYKLKDRKQLGAHHVRSKSIPPYRMSFDSRSSSSSQGGALRKSNTGAGMWKVRLVISPEQLVEILSQEEKTEELIESVRTVAKCGNMNDTTGEKRRRRRRRMGSGSTTTTTTTSGSGSGSTSVDFSDQWSVSSRSANSSHPLN